MGCSLLYSILIVGGVEGTSTFAVCAAESASVTEETAWTMRPGLRCATWARAVTVLLATLCADTAAGEGANIPIIAATTKVASVLVCEMRMVGSS
jgi:hypothetical protein